MRKNVYAKSIIIIIIIIIIISTKNYFLYRNYKYLIFDLLY